MAVHKCFAFHLKRKNPLPPTPDSCNPLLALSVFTARRDHRQLLGASEDCVVNYAS